MMVSFGYCNNTIINHKKDNLFGFDINQLTGAEVVKEMGEKGVSFEASDPYADAVSIYGHPERITSSYFIGHGLNESEIIGVRYEFDVPTGTEIDVDMKLDYLKPLLNQLSKKLGNYQTNRSDLETYYCWITDNNSDHLFSEICVIDVPATDKNAPDTNRHEEYISLYLKGWSKLEKHSSADKIYPVSLNASSAAKKDAIFGLNINQMTGASVLKALKGKRAKYTIPYDGDWNLNPLNPDTIISSYYLGQAFDPQKILKVTYEMDGIGTSGNDVDIDFAGDYRDAILMIMKKTFGKFVLKRSDQGEPYCYWETTNKTVYLFHEIYLDEHRDPANKKMIEHLTLRGWPTGNDESH
jgi:hypothetical protein